MLRSTVGCLLPSAKVDGTGGLKYTLCLKKNVLRLTWCNVYIHGSIATIFGTNVAAKVGNENIVYFPTSRK